jgi:hypothetical protein
MKREQIIDILKRHTYSPAKTINDIADAILALPLDVPSDEELYEWAGYCAGNTTENHDKRIVYQAALVLGAKWMKNGIIKRNTKK